MEGEKEGRLDVGRESVKEGERERVRERHRDGGREREEGRKGERREGGRVATSHTRTRRQEDAVTLGNTVRRAEIGLVYGKECTRPGWWRKRRRRRRRSKGSHINITS